MSEKTTTIVVSVSTWKILHGLKSRPSESFDQVVKKLIELSQSKEDKKK